MMTLHTSPCECFGSPCSCYNHSGTCVIEFHNICTFLSMTLQFWYCLRSPSLVITFQLDCVLHPHFSLQMWLYH